MHINRGNGAHHHPENNPARAGHISNNMLGRIVEEELREQLGLPEGQLYEFRDVNTHRLITSSVPDMQTALFFIEVKNSTELREEHMQGERAQMKHLRVLLQAARQQLLAQRYGRQSILMVGQNTPVDPEVAFFYDLIVRVPMLGGRRQETDPLEALGAVGGADPDEEPRHGYIIHPRGSQNSWELTEDELRYFLLGHQPRPEIMQHIQEPPTTEQLLRLLNLAEESLYINTELENATREETRAQEELFRIIQQEQREEAQAAAIAQAPADELDGQEPIAENRRGQNTGKTKQRKESKTKQKQEAKQKRQQSVQKTQQSKRATQEEKEQRARAKKNKLKADMQAAEAQITKILSSMTGITQTQESTIAAQDIFRAQQTQERIARHTAKKEKAKSATTTVSSEELRSYRAVIHRLCPDYSQLTDHAIESLVNMFIEEEVSPEQLGQLAQTARAQDHRRLLLGHAYRAVCNGLPDLFFPWLQGQTSPGPSDLTPTFFLSLGGVANIPYVGIIMNIIASAMFRGAFNLFTDSHHLAFTNLLQPIYHNGGRLETEIQRTEQNARLITALNTRSTFSDQYQQVLETYRTEFGRSGRELSQAQLEALYQTTTQTGSPIDPGEHPELAAFSDAFGRGLNARANLPSAGRGNELSLLRDVSIDLLLPDRRRGNIIAHSNIDQIARTMVITEYLSATNPEEISWPHFLESVRTTTADSRLADAMPTISIALDSSSLRNAESYGPEEQGIFVALTADLRHYHQEPEDDYGERYFTRKPEGQRINHLERQYGFLMSTITVFLATYLADTLVGGVGQPTWLRPHDITSTRDAIRSLRGQSSAYEDNIRESRVANSPSLIRNITQHFYRAAVREVQSWASTVSFYGGLGLFGGLSLAEMGVNLWQSQRQPTAGHNRNTPQQEQTETDQPRPTPTQGTTLRRRRRENDNRNPDNNTNTDSQPRKTR